MKIKRYISKKIMKFLKPGLVIVLYGPRQSGKTTFLETTFNNSEIKKMEKLKFVSGEDRFVQKDLSSQSIEKLRSFLGDTTLLIIDEAQHIPNIGINLKLIVDHLKKIKVIVSGSASFDLSNKIGEPLTGRKITLFLYPLWVKEIIENKGKLFYESLFETHLIYGSYPKLFKLPSLKEKRRYLYEIINSYLLKDILILEDIRRSKKIKDLLSLLAYQIGKEVSLSELGNNLELNKKTVERYLDLLEKSFVIFNIRGFSRNLRKEIYKNSRWYFWDNGVRKALINNFNPLSLRDDVGALWENYVVIERLKKQAYREIYSNNYFWRTYDKKEIDWVEERDGKLFGFEIKWKERKKVKAPKDWLETYRNASFKIINQENYLDFIL